MERKLITVFLLITLILSINGLQTVFVYAAPYDCASGNHNFLVTRTEPGDYSDGEIENTCVICGHTYSQILPAKKHLWGAWITDKEPTCTQDGERHRTCTTTTNHHRQYDGITKLGHVYNEQIISATCISAERHIYTCRRCGYSYEDTKGEKSPHNYIKVETLKPTEEAEGINTYTCSVCGDSYEEKVPIIEKHDHRYVVTKVVKAECEKEGTQTEECSVCADQITKTLPATGHNLGEWVVEKRENLTEEGLRYRECINDGCTYREEEVIPRGITTEITPVAVAVSGGSLLLSILGLIVIGAELRILSWEKNERIKRRAALWMKKG